MTEAAQEKTKQTGEEARCGEQGYVLLVLLLFVALMVIAAAVAAPSIAFQIKRDREEELVHRGVQYSRAIRRFTKSTGRYPASLDQLQETGGIRFIRKLYKDPVTGGDFKLLHMGDVQAAAANIPNLNPAPSENADGQSANAASPPADANAPATPDAASANPQSAKPAKPSTPAPNDSQFNLVGQVIFGVASKSKAETIREFDRKRHYNEWLFFYDPARDRGTEIKGPTSLTAIQPLQGVSTSNPPQPAQPAQSQQ